MAIIPRKSKTNTSEDNGIGFELVLVVAGLMIILPKIFEDRLNAKVQPFFIIFIIALFAYLLAPNKCAKGKNGYLRILLLLRFKLQKSKERIAKKTHEKE